ncbi:TVP38/TMEM64 family protein [Sinisalibacter aestuarii]|uniref:TVP38/TMEM64 family membrane protein n=1 Tax=Sinisalibacter aestuarii TaxID=2949426 RepID=A0ABQ5LVY4_9RHOB|nr:TVP38/TMEM64 family protein [Sinisalibacter aestuarii]GKY89165.1 TVP38/TMEM64 family protein [Sinisalibacter aestuarii]
MDKAKARALRQAPFLVILAVAGLGFVFLRPWLGFDMLSDYRDELMHFVAGHYWRAALAFMFIYILIAAFSLPGATLTTLTGGFLFGLFPGVLFNIAGATLGATGIFLAARMGYGERLAARIDASEGPVHRLKQGIDESQWSVLFLMRLLPIVPFFVANVVAALLNVSLWRFFVSTALGIVPGALVYTSVGAGLGEVFEAGERPDLGVIFAPHILWPLIGLSLLAALPIFMKLMRRERRG